VILTVAARRAILTSLAGLAVVAACAGSLTATAVPPNATRSPSAVGTPAGSIVMGAPSSSGTSSDKGIALAVVASQLDAPVDIATTRDPGRIYVAEQDGAIRTISNGRLDVTPFLDIADRVSSGGERGLLGLALHPAFPTDPRLFVDYTNTAGDTVIASFRVDASTPDVADPASERVLMTIGQPYANHNGGALAFGRDGMLYIGMGDGGSGGDPQGNGQRLDTLLGKILRIDVGLPGAAAPYAVPPDNPYATATNARPEIWLSGLRNPWRIRFDAPTGDLWIGDVGQDRWEEIDVIRSGTGGQDLGWNIMEGTHCFGADTCDRTGLTLPVAEYGHDAGCAVIGGVVARGSAVPAIRDRYVFADDCSGNIWTLDPSVDALQAPSLLLGTGRTISAIALGPGGDVLLTDVGGRQLLRIVGAP